MKLDVLALPFDQYQRYRLVSDLVNEVRLKSERFSVLDVGGRTGLLRAFLPKDAVALVDLEPSDVEGLVLGDGSRLPYKDKSFDIVATFDTLEHVPPARRPDFVAECARVAKRWVFIAGPYQSKEVEEAERILQRFLVDKLEVEHRYLEEHRHNGLPSLRETELGLEKGGARVASIGHGNLERWLALMSLSMYLDYEPRLRPLAARIFRFYNENLYASDHARPVYRHAVVAAFDGAKLPSGAAGLEAPIAPQGVLSRFQVVADEVVSFDRARTDWREERARLAEILATLERDLAGHRSSLEVLKTEKHEQERVLRTLSHDLAGHRQALEEERELAVGLREQLGAHRAETTHLLDVLRNEQERAASTLTALASDLEQHRASKVELENRIEQRDSVITDLESDLDHHRRALSATKNIVDEQRDAIVDLRTAIADRQAAVEALTAHRLSLEENLSDRENQIAILTDVRGALERELTAHREALGELERDLAGHKKVLAEREADLERHKRTVAALERELAKHRREHDAEVAAWSARVTEYQAVGEALSRDLSEHKKVLVDVEADLAGHRRLAADLRTELEAVRRAQARLTDELTRANQEITEKAGEIASASRVLFEQDALIGALRSDLKSRWKSVKRAVGPKRPTHGEPDFG